MVNGWRCLVLVFIEHYTSGVNVFGYSQCLTDVSWVAVSFA